MSRYIDEHRARFGVEPICQTLGVSASAYYQRASGERSARAIEDERLLERDQRDAQEELRGLRLSPTVEGAAEGGRADPALQVQRLMRANGIAGAKRRGKRWRTTTPDPLAQRRPDLVNRDFTARRPDRAVAGRSDLSALLGGPRVLQLRDRRLQPPRRGLAVRAPHAHHAGSRRVADGARHT